MQRWVTPGEALTDQEIVVLKQICAIWIFKMKDFPGKGKLEEIATAVLRCSLAPHTPLHSTLLPELQPQDTPRSNTEGKGMGTVSYICLQQDGTWKQAVAWENTHENAGI